MKPIHLHTMMLAGILALTILALTDKPLPVSSTPHYDVFQVIQITETSTINITLKHKDKETIVVFSVISSKCPNLAEITIGSWWALETYKRGDVQLISAADMCEIKNE